MRPQPTIHRYLNLLETSYLLVRLPAYAVNRTKRLIKAPSCTGEIPAWLCTWAAQASPCELISKISYPATIVEHGLPPLKAQLQKLP